MRQNRPWTMDDFTAIFSWFFLSGTVWILAGTTSFVSIGLFLANSLQFQEWMANRITQYLTSETGATVQFESVTIPWSGGKIQFNNVRVSRMPRSEIRKFEKHAAAALATTSTSMTDTTFAHDIDTDPMTDSSSDRNIDHMDASDPLAGVEFDEDEKNNEVLKNWMWFDLMIDKVEVKLSFMRWMDGKGLVQSAELQGVRGVVDRRHVRWDPDVPYDPVAARHKYTPGDFELEKFIIEDLLVTVYQPNGFRPYPVSIFNAQLDRFRKQWLFYDILCATSIVGSFDKCLFSVHSPQLEKSVLEQSGHIDSSKKGFRSHDIYHYFHNKKPDPKGVLVGGESKRFGVLTDDDMRKQGYKRKSRLRIDGVNIDHINRGVDGPPGWITSGTVDVTADIYIPQEAAEADSTELLRKLVYELTDGIELPQPLIFGAGRHSDVLIVGDNKHHEDEHDEKDKLSEQQEQRMKKATNSIVMNDKNTENDVGEENTNAKKFVMDMDFRFKDTKASVPLKTPELSYISNAMVRPIVGYISRNKTIVPIKIRIVMDLSNFDGAWTLYDSTLGQRMAEKLGQGFVDLTLDQQERNKRLKRIGFWSMKEMSRNLLSVHEVLKGTSRGFWSYLGTAN
ncbi:mitochondrial distribution and morphology protein family 31/32 [Mycotypha africana]|uniref:mitochondrial distribution and morphology protein family 31/32 n=1 Tax=Mycotypha africana TaxID=64632 RepID=UPI002301CDE1|nr:mitochondrial distribution and morphology protein family 31/32 [Mycotypha africana]KAI8979481.1 mitochondrial distribution and morphology protein family 31/32 [Mycotypha africana]